MLKMVELSIGVTSQFYGLPARERDILPRLTRRLGASLLGVLSHTCAKRGWPGFGSHRISSGPTCAGRLQGASGGRTWKLRFNC